MPITARSTLSGADDVVEDAAHETKSFADRVTGAVSDGVSNAADFVSDGVKSITAQAPKMGEWVDDQLTRASAAIRDKPIQSIAIVAGIAALVGAVFARR